MMMSKRRPGKHRAQPGTHRARSRWIAGAAALLLAGGSTALYMSTANAADLPANARTVVSLTFDDGYADQQAAVSSMDRLGLKGTFYVPSGLIREGSAAGDADGEEMTVGQLQQLQANGHEIGGHTLTHVDLTQQDPDEIKRQVCLDRSKLLSLGLNATSFAYPFAGVNAAAKQAVRDCGYNSARGLGDILSPNVPNIDDNCADCDRAETMPPEDPFELKAPNQVENTWTLADLQATVTNAESRGGWVALSFHHVDNTGGQISITPELFDEFATWLAARAAQGTVVATVHDVVGGEVKPAVNAPAVETRPQDGNLVQNSSLEEAGPDGVVPRCWQQGGWGVNTPTYSTTAARTGSAAQRVAMAGYSSGDAKLLMTMDLGNCAPQVVAGATYQLSGWYKSDTHTQFEIYIRDGATGRWSYWTSSPYFAASTDWTQAVFTTAAVPAGVDGLSFGLNIMDNGSLDVDDVEMYNTEFLPAEPVEPVEPVDPAGNLVQNPSLEDTGAEGEAPRCWQQGGWGVNAPTFSTTSAARTGSVAQQVVMADYASGDAKLLPALDGGTCAPAVTAGKTYKLGSWYTSDAATQFEIYTRDAGGNWSYWTSSPYFDPASDWTNATFTTPAIPEGVTGLSFGLNIMGNGTLTTDDYEMLDTAFLP